MKFQSGEYASTVNLIDQALQRITGQQFGYAPGESGSVAGFPSVSARGIAW